MQITVAELIEKPKRENQQAIVIFGSGDLTLLRLKDRSGQLQFEFSELYNISP